MIKKLKNFRTNLTKMSKVIKKKFMKKTESIKIFRRQNREILKQIVN